MMDNIFCRKTAVEAGDANGADVFDPAVQWEGFFINIFNGFGAHTMQQPNNKFVVATCGAVVTIIQGSAASANVTASDADGTVFDIAITAVALSDSGTFSRTSFTFASTVGGVASATF